MIKHKHKHIQWKKQIPWSSTLPIITVVTLIVTIILGFVVYNHDSWINTLFDQEIKDNLNNSYQINRLTDCYDNNLHPCTDDVITAWNNKHPENIINIAPPNTDWIDQYYLTK